MPIEKLKKFLDDRHVKYVVITHSKAYTAQGIAASAHISGKELAKTVMINRDGELCMAVLPASQQVNLSLFAQLTRSQKATLASEREFRDRFPDCEVGAMPPFGNLYGVQVYVDPSLTKDEQIVFNAGSHHELVKMAYEDYEHLVQPSIMSFAARAARSAA